MKRRFNQNCIENINELPADTLRYLFSFCKGSCANLACKRWNNLYYQVYKNETYNIETLQNDKLMLYLINDFTDLSIEDEK